MAEGQPNSRLETFCDGVFAIALTLLVIDIKIPASDAIGNTRELWLALRHLVPSVLVFVLSFVIILGLIRFRGHFPKGGYDVQNGITQGGTASAAAVH